MKYLSPLSLLLLLPFSMRAQVLTPEIRQQAERLINATSDSEVMWDRLLYFVDTYPQRLSGSSMLEESLDWIVDELKKDGFETVEEQPVNVPHWVRGNESLRMLAPLQRDLQMLGMGNSVGTGPDGITAEVLVVSSFDELNARADEVPGKIVLFNVPFTTYGATVQYRGLGPIEAAKKGAVAVLVRAVGPYSMQTPHTGNTRYEEGVTRIPGAQISIEDAEWMHRDAQRGRTIRVHLQMDAEHRPDTLSRNIIVEMKGSEFPDEIVVFGGHIDSWDVGQGVMDDAGGCFVAWEALRLMKELGIRPKRTIRLVFWTNEENGLRGGEVYKDSVSVRGELENHVLAIESDAGVFKPQGFGFTGSDAAFAAVQEIGTLLEPIGAGTIRRGGGGADIAPLNRAGNVPMAGLTVDGTRYFWYHHTHADTVDKLVKEDVKACAAAMGVLAYAVAQMEARLSEL
jgi:carboxypeptidase Q